MLKARESLEDYLIEQFDTIVLYNDKCKNIYNYAHTTYGIPKGLVSDLITKRMQMSEVSEFVLFILLDSLYKTENNPNIKTIDAFYTMQEAKHYRASQYEVKKIKFPLVFKMVQIADDQWIGKITIDKLMELRQAQLVNYNVNAQRTMQRVVKGGKETYKITLNQKAVGKIQDSFQDGSFISNTITLNLPVETNCNFYYDESNGSLVIKSMERLDITDGFHRYIAACQLKDIKSDFNYPMELRITNFSEDKAKQFIYQEDQKTQMRKIDSNAFNMNNAANIVVTRLNENVRFNLKGMVNRNDGIIPFGEFAELVNYFYFKGVTKEKERGIIIHAIKELTDNFNMLTEYDTKYLEHKMDYKTLLVAMFCFDYFKDKDIDGNQICEIIEKVSGIIKENENRKFLNKSPRRSLMLEVEKIVEGAM